MIGNTKEVVKSGLERATNEFTVKVANLGFKRTKKWFWVRELEGGADFIHLHVSGSSYGGPVNHSVSFRVHAGFRNYNDHFDALSLNGPNSDSSEYREKRFHLRFNAKSWSTYDRCITDLFKFASEICDPWFKTSIKDEYPINSEHHVLSKKLLGIKRVTKNASNKAK